MQILGVVIPKLEELAEPGRGRPAQDHPVHALRHDRPGHPAGHRPGVHLRHRQGHGVLLGGPPGAVRAAAPRRRVAARLPRSSRPSSPGTALLMWIGELISQRGVGNGMSMIIFASVVSRLPYGYYSIIEVNKWFWFVLIVALTLGIIVAVVFVELGQRRIPVQFAKRVVGRRMYGGQNTYIPLKVNQAGVDPDHLRQLDPAAAGDLLERPRIRGHGLLAWQVRRVRRQVHHQQPEPRLHDALRAADHRLRLLLQLDRLRPRAPGRPDPHARVASSPGSVPGPRPSATLPRSSTGSRSPAPCSSRSSPCCRTSSCGAATSTRSAFAGTSILIAVGVALELMRQIDSQLMLRNYEGFLK